MMLVVEGVELEVQAWGEGEETILLLHEGLGSVSHWRDFPERLAAATGARVIAWSRQGHGRSQKLTARRDPDYMHIEAERIGPLLDALNVTRAHLFGQSDGASIALLAAAMLPGRVETMILEAPHVLVEQITYDSIAEARQIYLTTDLPRKLARHHADVDHIFWMWNDIWLDPRFRNWNIENVLPAIRAPALMIQGLDDEYGTLDQLHRIAAILPETETLLLERCKHAPHRDQPEAVLNATAKFLKQHARQGALDKV
jgi:pimeloyl-ACP methyl ester carboxylesterase